MRKHNRTHANVHYVSGSVKDTFMGGYGAAGVPDIVACYKGRFLGIECKAGGNRTTALQVKNLNEIGRCGGVALVVNEDNVDQLEGIINDEVQSGL